MVHNPAEGHALPAEDVLRRLELQAVHRHLLAQAAAIPRGVLAQQRISHAQPLLPQYRVEQRARPVFPAKEASDGRWLIFTFYNKLDSHCMQAHELRPTQSLTLPRS